MQALTLTVDSWLVRFHCFMINREVDDFVRTRSMGYNWDSCKLARVLIWDVLKLTFVSFSVFLIAIFMGTTLWIILYGLFLAPGISLTAYFAAAFSAPPSLDNLALVLGTLLWTVLTTVVLVIYASETGIIGKVFEAVFRGIGSAVDRPKFNEFIDNVSELHDSFKNKYCKPVTFKQKED